MTVVQRASMKPSMAAWISPSKSPPRTAPVRLPMPPRTAAVNAKAEPEAEVELRGAEVQHVDGAGRAANAPPSANVNEIVPVDVDAHHRGGVHVLGRRAHGLARPRAP